MCVCVCVISKIYFAHIWRDVPSSICILIVHLNADLARAHLVFVIFMSIRDGFGKKFPEERSRRRTRDEKRDGEEEEDKECFWKV